MTCKENCIHCDVCKRRQYPSMYGLTNPDDCDNFKNKADFVEVVRCKDCVYCDRCYPVKEINKEATEGWYCNPNRHYVKPDDFCSYGERRDT